MAKSKYTNKSPMIDDMREHMLEDRKVPQEGLRAAKAKSKTAIKGNPMESKASPKEDYSAGIAAARKKSRTKIKGY